MLRFAGVAFCALALSGCAVTPRPEQTAGLDSLQIANYVRCEARDAVRAMLRGVILNERRAPPGSFDRELGERVRRTGNYAEVVREARRLHPFTQRLISEYAVAVVTYDFTFNISEQNNLSAGIGVTDPLTRGTLLIGAQGQFDRSRQNLSNFTLRDTFENLAYDDRNPVCTGRGPGPNHTYPITGEIGLGRQIRDFVNLNYFENLDARSGGTRGTNAHSTTYKFITTLSGTVNPVLTLQAMGMPPQLTSASARAEAVRTDEHQVIVVLSVASDRVTYARSPEAVARARAVAIQTGSDEVERQRERSAVAARESEARSLARLARCTSPFGLFCN